MKFLSISAGILICTTAGAQAQSFGYTGVRTFSFEGGIALPVNDSERSLIVENNTPLDGPAPWAVTELVGADVLDFGVTASFAMEVSAELLSGGSTFVRTQGVSGTGATDISGLWAGFGAIPGTFDDGYLMRSDWGNVTTVTTKEFAMTGGYRSASNSGFTWMAGVTLADFNQGIGFAYDHNEPLPGSAEIDATGANKMYGLTVGLGYDHVISDKWSMGLTSDVSVLHNNYEYLINIADDSLFDENYSLTSRIGETMSVRLDAAASLRYQYSESMQLTGTFGATNYFGIVSGLDNYLNDENTASVINVVTSDALLPYVRFGVRMTF